MIHVFTVLPLLMPQAQPIPAPTREDLDRERLAQIVRVIGREAVEHEGVPGLSIAVSRAGEVVAQAAYGYSDPARGLVVTPSTRFAIGSMTRQFTAAAALQLVEAGRIGLDDPLTQHLTGFPTTQGAPTIRQLLASRSGVPGWEAIVAKHPDAATKELDEAAFLALFEDVPFAFPPGTDFALDTVGYVLLSLVVQKASGTPFPDWITSTVVQPANLEDTAFCPAAQRPVGFAADCKSITEVREMEVPLPGAPRGSTQSLCATAADVARWQEALFGGEVLGAAPMRWFLDPLGTRDGSYGCAVHRSQLEGIERNAHTGGVGGFRVCAAYYPASRVSVVVLANCSTAEVDRIESEIARVAHGLAPANSEFPLKPEEERRLPGSYQLATTQVRVFLRDGHLWYEEPGREAAHLRSRGRGDFSLEGDAGTRVVFDLEGEKAQWFTLVRGGTMSRAIRME